MVLADFAYAAALVLAATFAYAAAVKFQNRAGTRAALLALDLPAAHWLATALPVAELAVASVLVVRPAAGAVVALALLAFFSTLLASRIRRGSQAPCGCFGATAQDPIGAIDLVRNLLLATFAIAALGTHDPTRPAVDAMVAAVGSAIFAAAVVYALRERRRRRLRAGEP